MNKTATEFVFTQLCAPRRGHNSADLYVEPNDNRDEYLTVRACPRVRVRDTPVCIARRTHGFARARVTRSGSLRACRPSSGVYTVSRYGSRTAVYPASRRESLTPTLCAKRCVPLATCVPRRSTENPRPPPPFSWTSCVCVSANASLYNTPGSPLAAPLHN